MIPAGEFLMGSEDAEEDERPLHRVHVDDFFLGLQPVTNAEYSRFTRETGHRSPAIYELPLVVKAGGAERERAFRQVGTPYVWEDGHPSLDRADHPVTLVRYDDAVGLLRVAVGLDREGVPPADRSRVGKGCARRGGVQTVSVGRPPGSQHGELSRRPGAEADPRDDAVPVVSAQRLRPLRHGRQRLGMGLRLVRRALLRDRRRAGTRPARRSATCGSSAAAAGWWPTCGCCRAATGTRCRPTPTRTRSGSASRAPVVSAGDSRIDRSRAQPSSRCCSPRGVLLPRAPVAAAAAAAGPPVIVTSGEGVVKRAPDRAWVSIARRESRQRTAQEAQRANTDAMTAVIETHQGGRASPPTRSRPPATTCSRSSTTPTASRRCAATWRATRSQVRVDALAKTGEVIDRGGRHRRDHVSGVRFDLKDRDGAEREALRPGGARRAPPRRRGRRWRRRRDRARDPDRGAARHVDVPAADGRWAMAMMKAERPAAGAARSGRDRSPRPRHDDGRDQVVAVQ